MNTHATRLPLCAPTWLARHDAELRRHVEACFARPGWLVVTHVGAAIDGVLRQRFATVVSCATLAMVLLSLWA